MFAPRSDHFATQTAVFHETPVDTIITALEVQEQDPFHVDLVYQLTVTKSNSDDATRLLEWLSFPTRKVASYTAQGAPVTLESTIPLRSLILRHHGLDRQGYEALTRFVRGHSSLTSLTVGVSVTSVPATSLMSLQSAVSHSNLRRINLSHTYLKPQALCSFIDHLRSSNLRELRLNQVLHPSATSHFDALDCASAIAEMLRPQSRLPGQDARSQSCGDVPQLEVLTICGNDFKLRGLKAIVAAITGSDLWPGNTSLKSVQAFSTYDLTAVDSDDEDAAGSDQDEDEDEYERICDKRCDCGGGSKRVRLTSAGAEDPLDSTDDGRISPTEPEMYSHVSKDNWQRLLSGHLYDNKKVQAGVVQAAVDLLAAARVIGCRSQPTSATGLWKLPREVLQLILRHLSSGTRHLLSPTQFRRVIDFACHPNTIGFGSSQWYNEQQSKPPRRRIQQLLPFQELSISLSAQYADYAAEAWDLWVLAKENAPRMLGRVHPERRADAEHLGSLAAHIPQRPMDAELLAFLDICGVHCADPWWGWVGNGQGH